MAAARRLIDVSAQRSRAAAQDGCEYFEVLPREPSRTTIDESRSYGACDIGQLKEWPAHLNDFSFDAPRTLLATSTLAHPAGSRSP
jgi:hypothetical protein